MSERCAGRSASRTGRAEGGQALVEVALVVPVLVFLALGVVGVGRVMDARVALTAVAREAARSAALAERAGDAGSRGLARGLDVAAGYGLDNGSLELAVDPGGFERGGRVRAVARYAVGLADLPLAGWARVPLESSHDERVERFRSRRPAGGTP